jgi:hypothetical protein
MTPDGLDLAPEAYAPITGEDIRVGDICKAVALPDLADPKLYTADDLPGRALVAVQPGYALVVAAYEIYATVVPVMVAEAVSDEHAFEALVSTGEDARHWMRLPSLESAWHQDAVALFFIPHTLLKESLLDRRVASMHEQAREVVARRFARAFSGDGD